MKKDILNTLLKAVGVLFLPVCMMMSSCSEDIDESNLYTFTGETIEDFLQNNDSAFSSFNYILERCGYDRILSSYGSGNGAYYTCFAPVNDAVAEYIDSLYNDTECKIAHNGMSENSLEGMSDSLCQDIATFHITGTKQLVTDMTEGQSIRSLLGRTFTVGVRESDGATTLNGAGITMQDYEVTNGVVHVLDACIPRSNITAARELQLDSTRFSIFYAALEATELYKILDDESEKDLTADAPSATSGYYIPTDCAIQYTVFAETDEVFRENGIESVEDLYEYCVEAYGECASGSSSTESSGWYDYYRNNGIEVSTGTDFDSEYNVLNMFMRYHMLSYGVSASVLAMNYNVSIGYGWKGDCWDYYETNLDKTLLKAWYVINDKKTYLNRYQTNNTLTDVVEEIGNNHTVVREGIEVLTDSVTEAINGYVYPIKDMLVYDYWVPKGVLNERIRVDALTFLGEVMSNGFRGMDVEELTVLNGGTDATRVRFPTDYFDNVVVYNGNNTQIDMNILLNNGNDYLLYKGDSFQGMGIFDFAIKLPPVPDGTYEIRINLDCMTHGTMLQYYLGTSSDVSDMEAVDIPLDMRITADYSDERLVEIGCVDIEDETTNPDAYEDRGIESDKTMRTHKYMRGPLSVCKEADATYISRFKPYQLRRILDTRQLKQEDYWMRLKTVLDDGNTERKFQLDYVEFVPVNVSSNDQYMEDMY